MPSLIEGYEYDIFISYRHKDNKYDGWVSDFVSNLRKEIEATFKDDISIYFDENPHDGLLETHNVDKSIEKKLKCLILIPILSQTYCDPKSFAWKDEFVAFVKMAKEDQLGLAVNLLNGNVCSRILPVQIHELDPEDKELIQSQTGSVLRAIEFIYRAPGVKRPLLPKENNHSGNLNKTSYRDQINKVANITKEILTSLRRSPENTVKRNQNASNRKSSRSPVRKEITVGLFSLILIAAIAFGISRFYPAWKESEIEKSFLPQNRGNETDTEPPFTKINPSIAVLPFEDTSPNHDQEYFSRGMMDEILNHLFKIGGLRVISRTSTMRYKGSKLSLKEIAAELGVAHVLEGSVQKDGDSVRIRVQLINGKTDEHLWAETYNKRFKDIFSIQSSVAQQVANQLKVAIDPDVKNRIEAIPTRNTEAYHLFLQVTEYPAHRSTLELMQKAISLDPEFANAYAMLGQYWIYNGGHGGALNREQVLEKAMPLIRKALELDENSVRAHETSALASLYYNWDFVAVEKEFKIVNQLNPSNPDVSNVFSDYLLSSGRFKEALAISKKNFQNNKNSPANWVALALTYYHNEMPVEALKTIETASGLFEDNSFIWLNSIRIYVNLGMNDKAIQLYENDNASRMAEYSTSWSLGDIGVAYFKRGNKTKSMEIVKELKSRGKKSPNGSPSFFTAAIYTAMGEKARALEWLEKAYTDHEVEMYWLKVDPLFKPLHGEPRFKALVERVFNNNKNMQAP